MLTKDRKVIYLKLSNGLRNTYFGGVTMHINYENLNFQDEHISEESNDKYFMYSIPGEPSLVMINENDEIIGGWEVKNLNIVPIHIGTPSFHDLTDLLQRKEVIIND